MCHQMPVLKGFLSSGKGRSKRVRAELGNKLAVCVYRIFLRIFIVRTMQRANELVLQES